MPNADKERRGSCASRGSSSTEATVNPLTASLAQDAKAAVTLANVLSGEAATAFLDLMLHCKGTILMSGIGKSGIVAERMSSSLSSVGIVSHFVHAAEWAHGDLGKARRGDICVFFSHSGNSRECVLAAEYLRYKGVEVLAITSNSASTLARISHAIISYNVGFDLEEPIGGVPTTSVVLQEMVINAVLNFLISKKGCSPLEFAHNHPGGSLGRKLHVNGNGA